MKSYLGLLGIGSLLILAGLVGCGIITLITFFWIWVFKPLDTTGLTWLQICLVLTTSMFTIFLLVSPIIYIANKKKDK
jgi:hypothetical protein